MSTELPDDIAHAVVGRRTELRLLLSAIGRDKAVLLLGLPGVSKTTMLRALARHLGQEPDRFVDVTGDEQLTAHALVGTFDPPMVLKDGYRPEHFVPGPLVQAMRAGGIVYLEEVNRAPSGALNVLITALSERYLEVPRLGRVDARPGFTVVAAANPLDDVARESRRHPDLRHGASVRGAIDFVDLLDAYDPDGLDLDTLRFLACSSYAGKVRVRPTVTRTACAIVHEILDSVLHRDYQASVASLLEAAMAAPTGEPAEAQGEATGTVGEEGKVALAQGGPRQAPRPERPDELPGLARPGGSGEPGESRSVPMVDRDRPSAAGRRQSESPGARDTHLRDLDEVLRRARELVLRRRDGIRRTTGGQAGTSLWSEPVTAAPNGLLDLPTTVEALVAKAGNVTAGDIRVLTRERQARNYIIFVDHSGSMVGRKLELGATLAAVLAQLSAAGRADYAVLAFDDKVAELKPLGEDREVEQVIDRILRLPEGRATDLGAVFGAAAELSERLPEATDVVLISDCMPTRGVTTFQGLASLARQPDGDL